MSETACSLIIDKINRLKHPVLGLATGSTPEGLYEQLIKNYKENKVSFAATASFNLDEYVGLAKTDPNSYYFFMNEKLFNHINIPKDRTYVPNGMADDLE